MAINVNGQRLWSNLLKMAAIGGTDGGGCDRQALTDLDIQGRALFASWCEGIGLCIRYDPAGNMFARLEGLDADAAPLAIGSHLDTQPTGGKFDGVLGVLAGLEAVMRLREEGITPKRPIEIVNWMNEEGARFAPAMMGSGVWAGVLDLDEVRTATDAQGITVGSELDRHGYSASTAFEAQRFAAYLELHIEQGPILEANDLNIGVMTGAQGIRWYDVTLTGQETHAGPSPMNMRKDPVRVLPALVQGIMQIGTCDPDAHATIGQIRTFPGSRNVVPNSVFLSVDLRHPNEKTLLEMHNALTTLVADLPAADTELTVGITQIWHSPVVAFDQQLVRAVRAAAEAFGYRHDDIVSGAGHDALMVSRRVPTAMIFVPCRDGISHNEAEHITPEQAEAGANVLLGAILDYLEI